MRLKSGTFVINISPLKPMFLYGYPHVERISTGINDPLLASALYLDNGRKKIILIALDIVYLTPRFAREARKAIAGLTGVDQRAVFISCSHTHSGPNTNPKIIPEYDPAVAEPDKEYMQYLKEQIVKVGVEATNNLCDAEIAWTNAHVDGVGCNRHNQDWVRDPEIGILVVRNPTSKNISALAMIYSMHPTVLHEDSKLVSADFPGYARRYLQKKLNGLTLLYHMGPSGNQSPRYHVKAHTFAEAERIGNVLGDCVFQMVSRLKNTDFSSDVVLDYEISAVDLPKRDIPSVEEAEENLRKQQEKYKRFKTENAGHGLVRTAECNVFGAEWTVLYSRNKERLKILLADYLPAEVQVLKIGKGYLVGLPCEIFVEYGLAIKKQADKKAFVVSLVNGHLFGYIVTPEAVEFNIYESGLALFKPESGDILVNEAVKIISSLYKS